MAIDPSIYAMSGRGVTPIEGPLDIAMKAAQLRQMGTQAQMGQLKLQEGQQNFQDTQAMRDLAKQSGGDPNTFMEGLLKLGTPAAIGEHAKLQTERLQQSKIDKEMRLAASQMTDEQLKQRKSLVDDLARAADWVEQGGVQAPQRWQQAMSHYPPQVQQMIGDYSPDKLALARAQAKSMEQVFKERQDKQKQEFEDRKQTETERHNKAMEKKPTAAMVMMQGGAGGGEFDPSQPLGDVAKEAAAQAIAKGAPREAFSSRNPDARRINARADAIAQSGGREEGTAVLAPQMKAAVKSWTGDGKNNQVVIAANTAVHHLQDVGDLAVALGNGDNQTINAVRNKLTTWSGGAAPTSFAMARDLAMDEVTKMAAGAQSGEGERKHMQSLISNASSPAQLKAAVKEAIRLMGGKLQGMEQDYNTTFQGRYLADKLAPETLDALKRSGISLKSRTSAGGHGAAPVTKQFADAQGNLKTFKLSADGKSWEPI